MGVRGFRPSGRVPFAAMQKEPKNRWGTARGTSGFALRPNGLTPRPRNRGPAALRWTDVAKSDTAHPACSAQKFRPLYGGYPVSPPRYAAKPVPASSYCRGPPGPPMRAAAESGGAQRGGAARASTTAHNWDSQARKDSGGHVPFSDRSGPGRPGRRGSEVRACAPDARYTPPIELPLGPGPQARGTLATFLPWKVARPQAKYPHPPSRSLAK